MRKTLIFMALSLVLVTLLSVACGGSDETTNPATTPTTTNPVTTPTTTNPVTTEPPDPTTTTPPNPTTTVYEDGFARVTCEEIHAIMDADPNWRSFANIKPVDARSSLDYDQARVPYADNVPNVLFTELATRARQTQLKILPKDHLLIFFCDTSGPMTVDLAQQLVDLNAELNLGFDINNIVILEGGLNRWLELGYATSNAEACGMV